MSGETNHYPNTRLMLLPIINITRSTNRSDKIVFTIDPGRQAAALREALEVRVRDCERDVQSLL